MGAESEERPQQKVRDRAGHANSKRRLTVKRGRKRWRSALRLPASRLKWPVHSQGMLLELEVGIKQWIGQRKFGGKVCVIHCRRGREEGEATAGGLLQTWGLRVWIWGSGGRGEDGWQLAYLLPRPEQPVGSQGPRSVFMPSDGHGTVSPSSFALKISFLFNTFNPEPPGWHRVSPIVKVLGIFLEFLPDDVPNRPNDICK